MKGRAREVVFEDVLRGLTGLEPRERPCLAQADPMAEAFS